MATKPDAQAAIERLKGYVEGCQILDDTDPVAADISLLINTVEGQQRELEIIANYPDPDSCGPMAVQRARALLNKEKTDD